MLRKTRYHKSKERKAAFNWAEKNKRQSLLCMCVNSFQSCDLSAKSNQKNLTAHTKKISLGENCTNTESALKLGLLWLSVALQRLLVSVFWMCWKLKHGSCSSAVKLPQTNTKTTMTTCFEQASAVQNASPKGSTGHYSWEPKREGVWAEISLCMWRCY